MLAENTLSAPGFNTNPTRRIIRPVGPTTAQAPSKRRKGRERVKAGSLPGNPRYGVGCETGSIYYKCRGRWRPVQTKQYAGEPYESFSFWNREAKRRQSYRKHRFVCETHRGPAPFPRAHAAHQNDDKRDNRPKNLRWKTAGANTLDAIKNGRIVRLGPDAARSIRKMYRPKRGAIRELREKFGITGNTVRLILSGVSYREIFDNKPARGYRAGA